MNRLKRKYTFFDESWWVDYDNTEAQVFNSDELTPIFGTAYCEEDCWMFAIAHASGANCWDDIPCEWWELSYSQLREKGKELGVYVEIITSERLREIERLREKLREANNRLLYLDQLRPLIKIEHEEGWMRKISFEDMSEYATLWLEKNGEG